MAGYTRGHLTRLSKDGHAESGRERSRQPEMMSCGSLTPLPWRRRCPRGARSPVAMAAASRSRLLALARCFRF